jgi:hypothetical protein
MNNPFLNPSATPQPAAAPSAPVVGPPRQAIDPRTAMHGLSSADVETRYPFLTAGHNYQLRLSAPRMINGQRIGLAWFFECEVLQSNDPGAQPVPGQAVMRCVKIDGFSSIKAKKFAESDLKQLLALLLAPEFKAWGIDVNWKPSAEDVAAGKTWENLCAYVLGAENPAAGRTFGASAIHTAPGETSGKVKLKCLFFAA